MKLEINQRTKSYSKGKKALDSFTLTLEKGVGLRIYRREPDRGRPRADPPPEAGGGGRLHRDGPGLWLQDQPCELTGGLETT